MNLREAVTAAADAARTRRRIQYYRETGQDPDELDRPVLIGHCYNNARELSWELTERGIPHRIVYGAIAAEFFQEPFYEYTTEGDIPDDFDPTSYLTDRGGVDSAVWDVVDKPSDRQAVPDVVNHYWVEVDLDRGDSNLFRRTLDPLHAEIAAEARSQYGEVFISTGHPERHYIKPETGAYVEPWENWNFSPPQY